MSRWESGFRRPALIAAAVCAGVAIAGCGGGGGGGGSDEGQIKSTFETYMTALADHDGAKACDQLGSKARIEVAALGARAGASSVDCTQILDQVSSLIGADIAGGLRNVTVEDVKVSGNTASGTPALSTGQTTRRTATFVKVGDRWLIESGLIPNGG